MWNNTSSHGVIGQATQTNMALNLIGHRIKVPRQKKIPLLASLRVRAKYDNLLPAQPRDCLSSPPRCPPMCEALRSPKSPRQRTEGVSALSGRQNRPCCGFRWQSLPRLEKPAMRKCSGMKRPGKVIFSPFSFPLSRCSSPVSGLPR